MKLNTPVKIALICCVMFWLASIGVFISVKHTLPAHLPASTIFLILFIIPIVSSILISALIYKIIFDPLKKISQDIKHISGKTSGRLLVLEEQEEIKQLSQSINELLDETKRRFDSIISNTSRFEAVLLSMFEGVMVVDRQGIILLMNQTLKDFLHVKENPIGKKPLEIIRNIEIQEITDKIFKNKSGVVSEEINVLVPEEKILLIHATAVVRDNTIEGGVMIFHDITQLRRLEQVRRDFVANVSHELRTPLASIKGYAETLLDGALDDKTNARDFVNIIHSDANRLTQLVNDLLDLSRIESGQLRLNVTPQVLAPLIERVIVALTPLAKEKRIKIVQNLSTHLPRVNIDDTAIAQVLLNLIENAIKYNQEGGTITVSAELREKFVRVAVSDTGIGIPPEDIPRIFERFYRVDKARSRELGGTGLGLSIAKHLVQAHDGEIAVESVLTQGSTFYFTLPQA